jgi:hypothetical protein
MGLLFDIPPSDPAALLLHLEQRLGDIAESLSEIATGIHMMGANQARAMQGQPPAFSAEDFGFDLLIPNPDQVEADREARIAAGEEDVCRVCGCSDTKACPSGCTWIEPGLCSSCSGKEPRL